MRISVAVVVCVALVLVVAVGAGVFFAVRRQASRQCLLTQKPGAYRPMRPLTIVTPSYRIHNLPKLYDSIDFDVVDSWIIVYDGTKIKTNPELFKDDSRVREYVYSSDGTAGHPQRNYALDLLQDSGQQTFVYFLDDDNIVHKNLYHIIRQLDPGYFYTFNQVRDKNNTILHGNDIAIGRIDTAMFIVDIHLSKNIRFEKDQYGADGIYISEIYNKYPKKWKYVDEIGCYYNHIQHG
jgi:hypothetical protein